MAHADRTQHDRQQTGGDGRRTDERRIDGRRILVTGASSGIGRATAARLAAAGARVALLARSAGPLEALAAEIGDAATPAPADVVDPDATARAVDRAVSALGGLDGVVNAAGVVHPGGLAETGPDQWRAMFEVNVLGPMHVTRAALAALREAAAGGGAADVINVSSMSGRRRASVAMTAYSASKFAVHVLSDGWREELGPDGIRVTTLSPGYTRTPIFDHVAEDETRRLYQQRLQDRGLDPGDVAAAVVHALAQPVGVELVEVALMATGRGR